MADMIEEIENLPHYRECICRNCGSKQWIYMLQVQTTCPNCDGKIKLRGFASRGSEIEDIIDAVLGWVGNGDEFELAMERKKRDRSFQRS